MIERSKERQGLRQRQRQRQRHRDDEQYYTVKAKKNKNLRLSKWLEKQLNLSCPVSLDVLLAGMMRNDHVATTE